VARLREPGVGDLVVRHGGVVVLAGVDQHLVGDAVERGADARGLDDLRARADDGEDAGAGHGPSE
jgi:hypothetical protein